MDTLSKELRDLADKIKNELNLQYDSNGVKFLEGFIERNKSHFAEDQWEGLITACGAFLGQCIIENFGGNWVYDKDGQIAIAFDEKNMVFPFSKVSKQFGNGLEDSIYSMYTVIPTIFKLLPNKRKKWWQF